MPFIVIEIANLVDNRHTKVAAQRLGAFKIVAGYNKVKVF
jgi:hypothetical protein